MEIKKMKMSLFDHLNNLTLNKVELNKNNDEETKSYTPYMISRFVSMCDMYIPIINEINKYGNVPAHIHHRFFINLLPKRKQYFKYIKKSKELNEEELSYIAKYFEVGIREAKLYINLLSKDTITEIIKIYSYGKNSKV